MAETNLLANSNIKGIDVSNYQGIIDWKSVKGDGVEFAILQTGASTSHKSAAFERNYAGAKEAGVKIGAYHYSYAYTTAEAVREAEYMLSLMKGKTFEYPIAYDMEENNQLKLGSKAITDIIIAFLEVIRKAGHVPMLYTNTNWWTYYIEQARIPYLLWQAHYKQPKPKAVTDRAVIWQYGSTGRVAGIQGNCDMNIAYRDLSVKTAEPAKPAPKPEEAKPAAVKVGSTVKVKPGAKTYDGVTIAPFVYSKTFRVDELKGARAVLDRRGLCTPFNVKDLISVN